MVGRRAALAAAGLVAGHPGQWLFAGTSRGATYASTEVLGPVADAPPGPERELAKTERLRHLATTWAREHPREEVALIPKKLVHLAEVAANVISIWIEDSKDPVLGGARQPFEVLPDVTWYGFLAAFAATLVVRRSPLRAAAHPP